MRRCPDGGPCEYWIIMDGSVVCRHGLCVEGDNSTGIDFKCPAKLMDDYEREKLRRFLEDLFSFRETVEVLRNE